MLTKAKAQSAAQSLKAAVWQWLVPLAVIVGVIMARVLGPDVYAVWMSHETGIIETVGGLITFSAFAVAVYVLFTSPVRGDWKVMPWIAIFAAAVFFYFGEDVNWGQYYLNLNVPDYLVQNNREQELNLHNMSSWFNEKPRAIVELWVLIAGIIVPLVWNWPKEVTRSFVPAILWPGRDTLAVGFLTIGMGLAKIVDKALGLDSGIRYSELQEFALSWFLLVYAWGLGQRARERAPAKA